MTSVGHIESKAATLTPPTDFFNKPVGITDLDFGAATPPPVVEPPQLPASKAQIKEKLSIMLESLSVALNTSNVGTSDTLTDTRRQELGEVGRFFLSRAANISDMDMDRLFEILGTLSEESKEGIRKGFSLMKEPFFDISNQSLAGSTTNELKGIMSLLDPIAECFRPKPTPPEPTPPKLTPPIPPPPPAPVPEPPLPPSSRFPRAIMPLIPIKLQLLGQRSTVFDRLA